MIPLPADDEVDMGEASSDLDDDVQPLDVTNAAEVADDRWPKGHSSTS